MKKLEKKVEHYNHGVAFIQFTSREAAQYVVRHLSRIKKDFYQMDKPAYY